MTLAPPNRHGDMERIFWSNVPVNLRGKVVSLDELKKLFPENQDYHPVEKLEEDNKHATYGRRTKPITFHEFLAYECKSCQKLIIGPPRIKDENTIGQQPLCGREGYNVYCTNCHTELKESTWAMS